jgi:glycosyltransferase involved in cell wall biosynthesis
VISVLLPFRNAAPTIAAALESIASQSLRDFELLAVDDGSTDASVAIVESFRRSLPSLTIITPRERGLVPALNAGLSAARGELVARMDADDSMHPERLAKQAAYLESNPLLCAAGCRVELFSEEGEIAAGYREYVRWQNRCVTPSDIAEEIYVESPLAHPSVMFRREVIAEAGSYRDGDFPEDYELWLRLHALGLGMGKVGEVLLRWRESAGRASRRDPRYRREAFGRLRASYLARDVRLRSGREIAVWGAGFRSRRRVALLDAALPEGLPIAAWIDIDPRKIGRTLRGAPVRGAEWLANRDRERPFVLVYVTNHGAREEIGAALAGLGYRRGTDWIAVG